MAVKPHAPPKRIFQPRWPDLARLDLDRVRLDYWHEVDSLLVYLIGRGRSGVSVPLDLGDEIGYFNLMLDPETDEVVGFHIEDFLAYAVKRRPDLLDALALAELHGVSAAELARMRSADANGSRPPVAMKAVLRELVALGAYLPYEG